MSTKIPFKGTGKEYIGDDIAEIAAAVKVSVMWICFSICSLMNSNWCTRQKNDLCALCCSLPFRIAVYSSNQRLYDSSKPVNDCNGSAIFQSKHGLKHIPVLLLLRFSYCHFFVVWLLFCLMGYNISCIFSLPPSWDLNLRTHIISSCYIDTYLTSHVLFSCIFSLPPSQDLNQETDNISSCYIDTYQMCHGLSMKC